MSSLIQGYNYDIFISYRQKDNKHDGWVTEFVENLKGELESTFKEEISVYFDINPHDGLLETHDVDESLKEKLKCLLFIPIISRTFCDPKAFAWEHEFKAFIEQASNDEFGLKVKLPNGNVASRVLPILIHDLDEEDIGLCESALRGKLRGIDFIYKEPGVNKPLARDDDEKKNLNKTKYRTQINKTALAIKEVISGLKSKPAITGTEKATIRKSGDKTINNRQYYVEKIRFLHSGRINLKTAAIVLILTGIVITFIYLKILKKDHLEHLRSSDGKISVVVMPFQNLTADTIFDIWQLGFQNLLITSLSNSDELSVRHYETIDNMIADKPRANLASLTPSFEADIASKLEASTVISGHIYKSGNKIRITANLMESRNEEIFQSYEIDGIIEEDFFNIADSLSWIIRNYLEIKRIEQKHSETYRLNSYTRSADALKCYLQGRNYHGSLNYNAAIEQYLKSVESDTNFVSPMLMLAYVYTDLEKTGESKKWAYEAYERIQNVSNDVRFQILEVKASVDKKPLEQINYLKRYLEFNPYSTIKLYTIGWVYFNTEQWQEAIDAFEKGIEINNRISPNYKLWIWHYYLLGKAYHMIGEHRKEAKAYEEGERLWPAEKPTMVYEQCICMLSQHDTVKANEYLSEIRTIGEQQDWPESEILNWFAGVHYHAGLYGKASKFYRQALALDPENLNIKNDLAYMLIKQDIDLNEGLELIGQVFEIMPDNGDYMYTYGLGLFKEGKLKEAYDYFNKSWELRSEYNHEHFQYLQETKKILEGL